MREPGWFTRYAERLVEHPPRWLAWIDKHPFQWMVVWGAFTAIVYVISYTVLYGLPWR